MKTATRGGPLPAMASRMAQPSCAHGPACTLRYRIDLARSPRPARRTAKVASTSAARSASAKRRSRRRSRGSFIRDPSATSRRTSRPRARIPREFASGHARGRRADSASRSDPRARRGELHRVRPDAARARRTSPRAPRRRGRCWGRHLGDADDESRAWVADAAGAVKLSTAAFPCRRATVFVVPAPAPTRSSSARCSRSPARRSRSSSATRCTRAATHGLGPGPRALPPRLSVVPRRRALARRRPRDLLRARPPRARRLDDRAAVDRLRARDAARRPRQAIGARAGALAHATISTALYWGGALFALMADVRIREATRRASLDDVMRAALARGGDATHVWTVADVIALGDDDDADERLSRSPSRATRSDGEPIDLDAHPRSLGVESQCGPR